MGVAEQRKAVLASRGEAFRPLTVIVPGSIRGWLQNMDQHGLHISDLVEYVRHTSFTQLNMGTVLSKHGPAWPAHLRPGQVCMAHVIHTAKHGYRSVKYPGPRYGDI